MHTHVSTVLDENVLGQSLGEQARNMIIHAYWEDFDLAIMNMFREIMVVHVNMLCVRHSLGSLVSFKAPALSMNILQNV